MLRPPVVRFLLLCGWVAATLLASAAANAQSARTPSSPPAEGSADAAADAAAAGDLAANDVYGWGGPDAETQLASDRTLVPGDRGAIFVPYISDPAEEPEYAVLRGGRRVGTGAPGTRLIVDPGDYRLELGSGRSRDVVVQVKVLPGQTTLVPVTWAALRVEVVDQRNIPHRGGYELIRVADRDIYGVGYGSDLLAGERLQTWILAPDLYRIVQPGSSYRTRSNYATVYLPEGGFVRYRLVMDPETGEFRGAGVITPDESGGAIGGSRLTPNLVVGVNGSLSIDDDIIGTAELVIDGGLTFEENEHAFLALLQVEEGLRWIDPEIGDALPLQKSSDRFRLDLLHTYELTRAVGPYVRAGVEAALLPSTVTTTEDISVTFVDSDGGVRVRDVDAGTAFRTAEPFGRSLFFEGAGINAWLVRNDRGQLRLGAGVGFRQGVHRRLFVEIPVPDDTPEPVPDRLYERVDDFFQEGVEALLTGRLRLGSSGRVVTNLEVFSDFGDFAHPSVLWDSTASLRLIEYLSLDYVLKVRKEPAVTDELDVSHQVLLRFAWEIL